MKIFFIQITAIIIFLCFFSPDLIAQRKFPYNVSHPSIRYSPPRPSINIDTVLYYDFAGQGEDPYPFMTRYTRSEDLLTDTVHFESQAVPEIYRYNDKNQLIYGHPASPQQTYGISGYMRTDFEYDEEGRMIRLVGDWIGQKADPNRDYRYEKTWDYSNIQMTEKGYIFNGVECELDDQGRITLIKRKAPEERFEEYIDGKMYRINDSFYAYTDSSITEFGCFPLFDRPHEFADSPLQWMLSTDVFTEHGDEKSHSMFISDDGINWRQIHNAKTVYIYNDNGSSQTHSNEGEVLSNIVTKTNTTVSAHSGLILIYTENAITVQIFDISGRPVKKQTVPQGESRISIASAGLYFVKVGNESFKIFVR